MDKTLALGPNFAPALVARAQYLTKMPGIFGGDEQEAIRCYEQALKANPGYLIAYYYLAELDVEHGRNDEAIKKLNTLINHQHPENFGNWAKIDLPWAMALLKEVRYKQKEAQ